MTHPVKLNGQPLVTVAIPTYNSEPFLAQTLQSALDQTYLNFEIVVYDDRSTDRTREIVKGFKDKRIRFVLNESTLGASGNWNNCIKSIAGKYFMLLPHDDLLHPMYLEKKVEVFERDTKSEISLVGCARYVINSGGQRLLQRRYCRKQTLANKRDVLKKIIQKATNPMGEPASLLIRSKCISRTQGFPPHSTYATDLGLWMQLLDFGKYHYLNEPLCSFRISPASWTSKTGTNQKSDFMSYVDRLLLENDIELSGTQKFRLNLKCLFNQLGRLSLINLWS